MHNIFDSNNSTYIFHLALKFIKYHPSFILTDHITVSQCMGYIWLMLPFNAKQFCGSKIILVIKSCLEWMIF